VKLRFTPRATARAVPVAHVGELRQIFRHGSGEKQLAALD
jgi:hypothetical protein